MKTRTERGGRLRGPFDLFRGWGRWCGVVALAFGGWVGRAEFMAGAAVADVTPPRLPVLVNGGMFSRSLGKVKTPVNARALALAGGREQMAIVVVDSCMMSRGLLDEAKSLAAKRTGIRRDRMLISATHTHSAPASMGCLGTDADPAYAPFLADRIAAVIEAARAALRPARIGFGKGNAAEFTALRRWIRRPDRVEEDPFGNRTVRANMHAGRNWDDVTGEAGPEDPDLALISVQTREGRPLAVLGNFSMHYFGDDDISADYFGLFCEGLKRRLGPGGAGGDPVFVGLLSHGCSGDIWRRDYTKPESEWDSKQTIEQYAEGLVAIALKVVEGIQYREDADLAMAERRMTLNYRVPDAQRLEWARRIAAGMTNRAAKTTTEVYAREQLFLHEAKKAEVVVQALRIGDIAIATSPCETYAVTGLKIKAASPLAQTMVIELANGGDGYIPPPEHHLLGGYNTWPARSAGLEEDAEPRIVEAALELLEKVSGRARREWRLSEGEGARDVLRLKPLAYWRLNEFTGPFAADASGHGRDAVYEPEITFYLEGPRSDWFCAEQELNRAPHLAGGRLRARLAELGDVYSVSMWVWNGMPNEGREVSGWFISRGRNFGLGAFGEHLGIGGNGGGGDRLGRLIYFAGGETKEPWVGKTLVPRWRWQHAGFVREKQRVTIYLNGAKEIEADAAVEFPRGLDHWFFGGRSDNEANWEGRLDEIAVFDRGLTMEEMRTLAGKAERRAGR